MAPVLAKFTSERVAQSLDLGAPAVRSVTPPIRAILLRIHRRRCCEVTTEERVRTHVRDYFIICKKKKEDGQRKKNNALTFLSISVSLSLSLCLHLSVFMWLESR